MWWYCNLYSMHPRIMAFNATGLTVPQVRCINLVYLTWANIAIFRFSKPASPCPQHARNPTLRFGSVQILLYDRWTPAMFVHWDLPLVCRHPPTFRRTPPTEYRCTTMQTPGMPSILDTVLRHETLYFVVRFVLQSCLLPLLLFTPVGDT